MRSLEPRRSTVCEIKRTGPEKNGFHPPKPSQTLANTPKRSQTGGRLHPNWIGNRSAAGFPSGMASDMEKWTQRDTQRVLPIELDDSGPRPPRRLVPTQQLKKTFTYSRPFLNMTSTQSDFRSGSKSSDSGALFIDSNLTLSASLVELPNALKRSETLVQCSRTLYRFPGFPLESLGLSCNARGPWCKARNARKSRPWPGK